MIVFYKLWVCSSSRLTSIFTFVMATVSVKIVLDMSWHRISVTCSYFLTSKYLINCTPLIIDSMCTKAMYAFGRIFESLVHSAVECRNPHSTHMFYTRISYVQILDIRISVQCLQIFWGVRRWRWRCQWSEYCKRLCCFDSDPSQQINIDKRSLGFRLITCFALLTWYPKLIDFAFISGIEVEWWRRFISRVYALFSLNCNVW